MCGVCGILRFDGSLGCCASVDRMSHNMSHRGPDGDRSQRVGPVILGHRRLSIIDLEGGAQPMSNEDGSVWVTYNGELYNYRELRVQLLAAGHHFRSSSDTEVIVHAWEEWGERCVEQFRGMFAFAIADENRRELFLARDHLGIKPLYYYHSTRQFAFASELQALLALPDFPNEIDLQALDDYLRLLYVPAPRTIYRNVSKLPPAHRITIGFDGKTDGPEPYWTLQFRAEENGSFDEWSVRLEEVLRDSVRAHLVADVPFGAFLSGGIDSTAIVGLMAEEMTEPVRTFSIGFDESDFSELEYAREVAQYWKTDHHEEIVRPDALSILPELVRHYGEPFGDSSAIPTYYVSRLARHHVPMVLTGDGGDEALLGYGRYLGWRKWVNPGLPQRPRWKQLVRPALARISPNRFPTDSQSRPCRLEDWLGWVGSVPHRLRRDLWHPDRHKSLSQHVKEFEEIDQEAAGVPPEQYGQYIDYRTYLPYDILTKVDIASMCHSLETRTPLVDVRVAEFAAIIPWHMNVRRNEYGNWTGKHLLKQYVAKHFGPSFVERKKTGFGVPLKHWFATGGALRTELCDRFVVSDARIYEFFQRETVHSLIDGHGRENSDSSQLLWQLLFLENWLEQNAVTV
ncbi:MAG: asparagine synthase (glutamine-hydrolyzing) [Planctomycetaceae bacterium]|nr:asparagine synthase (glutamine-hydrolyzing) [Planctomycetaceae bacterium]